MKTAAEEIAKHGAVREVRNGVMGIRYPCGWWNRTTSLHTEFEEQAIDEPPKEPSYITEDEAKPFLSGDDELYNECFKAVFVRQ